MHPSLLQTDHRPWPLPTAPWKWRQSWLDLAFIHYPVPVDELARRLPAGLRLQEFGGSAWIGVVPFRMSGVSRRPLPNVPFLHTFPELNLRTYVEYDGKPGVWFFSLDTSSWPFVLGGKHVYGLPYFHARMRHGWCRDWCHFFSERPGGKAAFEADYRPLGEVFHAKPGSFEHWATERYCLYSHSPKRGLERVEVHHPPWPLQRAEVRLKISSIPTAAGITLPPDSGPVCHFSKGVSVVSFGVEKILPAPGTVSETSK